MGRARTPHSEAVPVRVRRNHDSWIPVIVHPALTILGRSPHNNLAESCHATDAQCLCRHWVRRLESLGYEVTGLQEAARLSSVPRESFERRS